MFLYLLYTSFMLIFIMYMLFVFMYYKGMKDMEMLSSYECGFDSNSLTRKTFSYRFYLISILFIIFDVEISLMFPVPYMMNMKIMIFMFIMFIMILIIGLIYEYFCGSLSWLSVTF